MSNIIVITGPTGCGKSTVSKELCKKFDKAVRIDVDRVKHFIVSGFVYDNSSTGKEQWKICVENIVFLAKKYAKTGYTVVIEGYLNVESPGWNDIFNQITVDTRVLLLPRENVVQERNTMRTYEMQMDKKDVTRHITYFKQNMGSMFTVLDTSDMSVDETIEKILAL